mgnify:CR=1 FL=1|jgi:4-amino-4-deoxy-L-arabinose transferase and related glycosyltransferases of PMT family
MMRFSVSFAQDRRSKLVYLLAAGFCLFFLCRYLTSLTDVHTFDALSYVLDVERKPWVEIFHPHHVAYGLLGKATLGTARLLGYTGTSAEPLQVVNAIAGALGVASFFVLVARATRRLLPAAIAALLLGGSYAFWYYAVEIEVYTVSVLFLIIALGLMLRLLEAPSRRLWVLLGIAQSGAILFHQTNVLLTLPIAVVALVLVRRAGSDIRRAWRVYAIDFGLYLLIAAGVSVLAYAIVGLLSGFQSLEAFLWWMTNYARTGWWGGPITDKKWELLAEGLSETLAQPDGGFLGLLLLGLICLHGRTIVRRYGTQSLVLLSWLLVYGGFFLWWEPDNIEFWIASLPPFLLLLAYGLCEARAWQPSVWIAGALACTVFAVNNDAILFRGDERYDLERRVTDLLAERTAPADFLLVPDGMQELYLPYYAGRTNYLSINQAIYDALVAFNESGAQATPQPSELWDAACTTIQQRIEASLANGARVVIADDVLKPPKLLLERHQLDLAAVEACFGSYREALIDMEFPAPLSDYAYLPNAQEQSMAGGWDFRETRWGWQTVQIEDQGFDEGWLLLPGEDGRIVSPSFELDSSRIAAIELELAHTTQVRDAQLFFADRDGAMSDEASVRWELADTEEVVRYRLELADEPAWNGLITRLRFDPVGVGDGGIIRLLAIRLIER